MYDIIFITQNSIDNNESYLDLKQRFPTTKIAKTFDEAKKKCLTRFFWLVPDDVIVDKNFDFSYEVDEWSRDFIHVFKNKELWNGVALFPKKSNTTEIELSFRNYTNIKQVDIIASNPKPYDVFEIDNYDEYLAALENSSTEMFWMSSRNITAIIPDLYFLLDNTYDRNQNHAFIHQVNDEKLYNGLFLCSTYNLLTEQEVEHRHLINRKEWDITASKPKPYDIFEIDNYNEYLTALENSSTEMFWMSSRNITAIIPDLYFTHDNIYDRNQNHAFIHQDDDEKLYNGLFLCSKHAELSKNEIETRTLINRKEWDIVGSTPKPYDVFEIDNYDEYLSALENSSTEMFWMSSRNITAIIPDLCFAHDNIYDRNQNHAFIHQDDDGNQRYNGLFLCSKHTQLSKNEIETRTLINRKEWDIVASNYKPYDIVFISYQEPNADHNYNEIQKRFPTIKRIHGVKGIHQAHIAAAKLCTTEMIWIVDGDAHIMEDFDFSYRVPKHQIDHIHVWRSLNPINDLVYGYGGIKLFPKLLTINMDTSKPDMTTSISSKFKPMPVISNVTAFNTDPFNTWKSAFRECCKLSSKVIDRQKEDETKERLRIWCSTGASKPFGKYALDGAKMGTLYGKQHNNDIDKLKLINNFEWLEEQFNARNI